MLSKIFIALGDLHTKTGWDPTVGAVFTEIGKALAEDGWSMAYHLKRPGRQPPSGSFYADFFF